MSSISYDTREDEERDVREAARVLATHGVQPGKVGLDLSTLAAAVYAHGWGYGIDCVAGEFRAEIIPLASQQLESRVYRMGSSPEIALSLVLAHALSLPEPSAR